MHKLLRGQPGGRRLRHTDARLAPAPKARLPEMCGPEQGSFSSRPATCTNAAPKSAAIPRDDGAQRQAAKSERFKACLCRPPCAALSAPLFSSPQRRRKVQRRSYRRSVAAGLCLAKRSSAIYMLGPAYRAGPYAVAVPIRTILSGPCHADLCLDYSIRAGYSNPVHLPSSCSHVDKKSNHEGTTSKYFALLWFTYVEVYFLWFTESYVTPCKSSSGSPRSLVTGGTANPPLTSDLAHTKNTYKNRDRAQDRLGSWHKWAPSLSRMTRTHRKTREQRKRSVRGRRAGLSLADP